jgi:hypothetical protein
MTKFRTIPSGMADRTGVGSTRRSSHKQSKGDLLNDRGTRIKARTRPKGR